MLISYQFTAEILKLSAIMFCITINFLDAEDITEKQEFTNVRLI